MIEALRQMGSASASTTSASAFLLCLPQAPACRPIKIDGILFATCPTTRQPVFVQAMVSVALGLGKSVVAEYVGTRNARPAAQVRRRSGAGYHLDRPVADHPALKGTR